LLTKGNPTKRLPRGRALTQTPWTMYFERELFLEPTGDDAPGSPTLHAYLTSPVGKGPLFVMHHGAGSSGLSFAVVGAEIRKRLPSAGILSHDARGHGETATKTAATSSSSSSSSTSTPTPPDGFDKDGSRRDGGPVGPPLDLSLQTLADDLLAVITRTRKAMRWPELPPIILVGHSLGGAVVTELARSGRLGTSTLLGYAVFDVVEGSAMDALQSMQTYLSTRPTGFASVEAGIEWHVRSRTVRNAVSARVSVPALLRYHGPPPDAEAKDGGSGGGGGTGSSGSPRPWRWRTDLASTQPFWENWFVGLSKKFLEAKGGKLLLLAGTDRLDTELTIGQMQGEQNLSSSCAKRKPTRRTANTFGFSPLSQASTIYRYSQRPATLYTRICPRRRPTRWWISTSAMTGVRWCCRPRSRTY
jgi:protein phosphatase methylesterase 1